MPLVLVHFQETCTLERCVHAHCFWASLLAAELCSSRHRFLHAKASQHTRQLVSCMVQILHSRTMHYATMHMPYRSRSRGLLLRNLHGETFPGWVTQPSTASSRSSSFLSGVTAEAPTSRSYAPGQMSLSATRQPTSSRCGVA